MYKITNECLNTNIKLVCSLTDFKGIVEKNPRKFKIDDVELSDRRAFIDRTKNTVKVIIQDILNMKYMV